MLMARPIEINVTIEISLQTPTLMLDLGGALYWSRKAPDIGLARGKKREYRSKSVAGTTIATLTSIGGQRDSRVTSEYYVNSARSNWRSKWQPHSSSPGFIPISWDRFNTENFLNENCLKKSDSLRTRTLHWENGPIQIDSQLTMLLRRPLFEITPAP